MLAHGESLTLTFALTPAGLASYNTAAEAWMTDVSTYQLKAGAFSADIR